MNLAEECFEEIGTIIHEFLHCLGFVHQHCSPERDMFINLLWRNIDPGQIKPVYLNAINTLCEYLISRFPG